MSLHSILYVHHRSELGGAPASLAFLIRQLDRDRFAPHVYCPPGSAAELFRAAGATVHEGPVSSFTHIWASRYAGRRWLLLARDLGRLPAHVRAFQNVLNLDTFSIVHLNDSPLLAAGFLAHRRGIPVVWHVRSSLPVAEGPLRTRFVRATIGRFATATIAINRDVAASLSAHADVIPNGIDLERFHPGVAKDARRALGLPDRFTVGVFGFMYSSKGYEDAIDAVGILTKRGVDVTLIIVGGAVRDASFFASPRGRALQTLGVVKDDQRAAEERLRKLGLESTVRFLPFTHEPEIAYRASDVVLAPSRGPELGRPVLEAAATGRPVVASGSHDGAGLILPGETGLLVPPRSPAALAAAVETLKASESLRMHFGMRARALAESDFNPATNAQRVMEVYERILGDRTSMMDVRRR